MTIHPALEAAMFSHFPTFQLKTLFFYHGGDFPLTYRQSFNPKPDPHFYILGHYLVRNIK